MNTDERQLKPSQYHGELAKRQNVSGLILTDVVYPMVHRTPRHTHERAYFSLALQGLNDVIQYTSRSYYQPAASMFHPVGVLHTEQVRRALSRSFFVEIRPGLLERVGDHLKLTSGSVAFHHGVANKLGARLYQEFRRMDESSPLAIEGLVLEMLAECSREAAGGVGVLFSFWGVVALITLNQGNLPRADEISLNARAQHD